MSEPVASIRIPTFLGLQTNRDAREVEPGASSAQMNVATNVPGTLAVRKGIRPYEFDSTDTISTTAFNTFRRLCFCRARNGDLFGVNGLDKPFRWDGYTATVEEAGIRAPTAAPTVSTAGGGAATAGTYLCYYRYIDDTLPAPIPGSLSPVTEVVATANQQFQWSAIPASLPGRAYKTQLWRTTADETNTLYLVTTLNEGTTTYNDTLSDNTLLASSDDNTLKILLEDGTINANRFTPPPSDRPVMVMFQDRYWFAGQVHYNLGTVTTNGTTTVTGSGTAWTAEMAGRYIAIEGEVVPHLISTASATSLTLATTPSSSGSGKEYVIYPDPTYRRTIWFSEVNEPESVPETNSVTIQENTGDDDEVVGLIEAGSYLFLMTERHRYALSFSRQPRIDVNVSHVDSRGLLNHFCYARFDDVVFCMDDAGAYIFRGSGRAEPIDAAVHDLWRNGTIDFAKRDKFFVCVDRGQERVYFFVIYATDSDTLPRRALVYNVRTATWDHFEYPQVIGAATPARLVGVPRLLMAGENSSVHLADEGTTDVIEEEIRGTVTSATSTTLTDSGAAFTDDVLDTWVYIYEGTGKGQRRQITAQTSTELTVAEWTTTPDTTSKYIVGAIPWSWKTGRLPYVRSQVCYERSLRVAFSPTEGDYRMDLRMYHNYDDTPEEHSIPVNIQGGSVYVDPTNKTDVVFRLESDQSGLEDKVGYEQFRWDGHLNDRHHTDRTVALELRGFQGDEAIALDELEINGVAAGGGDA